MHYHSSTNIIIHIYKLQGLSILCSTSVFKLHVLSVTPFTFMVCQYNKHYYYYYNNNMWAKVNISKRKKKVPFKETSIRCYSKYHFQ